MKEFQIQFDTVIDDMTRQVGNTNTELVFVQKNAPQWRYGYYVILCPRNRLDLELRVAQLEYPNARFLEPECDDALYSWFRYKYETLQDYYEDHFNIPEELHEEFESVFQVKINVEETILDG